MANAKSSRSETDIQRTIQVDCTDDATRLWRMQSGNFELKDGRRINVGFPGIADLLGCRSVIVTPDMVGQRVALLAAVEVKAPGARTDPDRLTAQICFISNVRRLGGRAGFATDTLEALAILDGISLGCEPR